MPQPTIGAPDEMPPLMDHLEQVLLFGQGVVIGKGARKREWILGNRSILRDLSGLTGQVGWQMVGEQQRSRYLSDTQEWSDDVEAAELSAHAPFAFDGHTRILGVLKHRSFGEKAVAQAFEDLLRVGEMHLTWPSTEWSVEPILDERDFINWLGTVRSVTVINLVAKLPNPDGLEQFGPVWTEMQQRKARLLSMKMVATNEEDGLEDIMDDERVRGHLAMGGQGFGYVHAEGPSRRSGGKRIYDQREKVARRVIDEVGSTWRDATTAVLAVTRNSADALDPVDMPQVYDPDDGSEADETTEQETPPDRDEPTGE
jgi:hypothetical protein